LRELRDPLAIQVHCSFLKQVSPNRPAENAMLKRLFLFLLVIAITTTWLHAADGSFAGKWKLNPGKSTMHDQMKVTPAGANRYAFDFGGGPEFIVVNGTDQPGLEGSTLAVTAEGPHVWRVVRKQNGRMQISAIWTLSPDGNSLRDDFTGYPSNGSSFTIHYIYSPIGGASGFAATWDSSSEKPGPVEIEVQPYQDSGLSFINQTQHSTKDMKLDGKDYPVKDANAPAGATSSSRRLNASTLEFTEKRNGKVADTQHIQLSPDEKTLTMTIQRPSGVKPNVLVFERE
jgi:hypothetical protein